MSGPQTAGARASEAVTPGESTVADISLPISVDLKMVRNTIQTILRSPRYIMKDHDTYVSLRAAVLSQPNVLKHLNPLEALQYICATAFHRTAWVIIPGDTPDYRLAFKYLSKHLLPQVRTDLLSERVEANTKRIIYSHLLSLTQGAEGYLDLLLKAGISLSCFDWRSSEPYQDGRLIWPAERLMGHSIRSVNAAIDDRDQIYPHENANALAITAENFLIRSLRAIENGDKPTAACFVEALKDTLSGNERFLRKVPRPKVLKQAFEALCNVHSAVDAASNEASDISAFLRDGLRLDSPRSDKHSKFEILRARLVRKLLVHANGAKFRDDRTDFFELKRVTCQQLLQHRHFILGKSNRSFTLATAIMALNQTDLQQTARVAEICTLINPALMPGRRLSQTLLATDATPMRALAAMGQSQEAVEAAAGAGTGLEMREL